MGTARPRSGVHGRLSPQHQWGAGLCNLARALAALIISWICSRSCASSSASKPSQRDSDPRGLSGVSTAPAPKAFIVLESPTSLGRADQKKPGSLTGWIFLTPIGRGGWLRRGDPDLVWNNFLKSFGVACGYQAGFGFSQPRVPLQWPHGAGDFTP